MFYRVMFCASYNAVPPVPPALLRATDLATMIKPVTEPYYYGMHSKVCKPLFSMLG